MVKQELDLARVAMNLLSMDGEEVQFWMDYYNTHCVDLVVDKKRRYFIQYDDSWCAMFTSVCAQLVGIDNNSFPYEVSVWKQKEWALKNNKFTKDHTKVKRGDLVIYNWNGDFIPDHVGIVESIKNGVIKVVEGNYRNTVGIRTVNVESKNIDGYITF